MIEEILKKIGLPVKYYDYVGTKQEYIIYNEEAERPVNYADNFPKNTVTWWQVHLFVPKEFDFRSRKKQIIKLLQAANFTVTDAVTLYEKETKTIHVVVSCQEREE